VGNFADVSTTTNNTAGARLQAPIPGHSARHSSRAGRSGFVPLPQTTTTRLLPFLTRPRGPPPSTRGATPTGARCGRCGERSGVEAKDQCSVEMVHGRGSSGSPPEGPHKPTKSGKPPPGFFVFLIEPWAMADYFSLSPHRALIADFASDGTTDGVPVPPNEMGLAPARSNTKRGWCSWGSTVFRWSKNRAHRSRYSNGRRKTDRACVRKFL